MSVPCDKESIIPDVRIEVADDGVYLGFFPANGEPVLVNVEHLAGVYPPGSRARTGLAAWAAERRASQQS